MADITIGSSPTIDIAGTTQREITLASNRLYMVYHTGKDAAGADSAGEVYLSTDGENVVTSYAASGGKIVLQSGAAMPIPPNCTTLKTKTASGSVALQIVAGPNIKVS